MQQRDGGEDSCSFPLIHVWYPTSSKSGSWISTGDEASRFARYAFRRHFFQHLGFRLVRCSSTTPAAIANPAPVRLCKSEVFVLGAGVTGETSENDLSYHQASLRGILIPSFLVMAEISIHHVSHSTENPTVLDCVDPEKSYVDSANTQHGFESEQCLAQCLEEQFGNVRIGGTVYLHL